MYFIRQTWTTDKIRSHLEQGIVPVGDIANNIDIPEEVMDCILIYGQCQCQQTGEIYVAPRCLPTSARDNFVSVRARKSLRAPIFNSINSMNITQVR